MMVVVIIVIQLNRFKMIDQDHRCQSFPDLQDLLMKVGTSEFQKITFHEWIQMSERNSSPGYIKSAILIALKLTEGVISEADKDVPISLGSLVPSNVYIIISQVRGEDIVVDDAWISNIQSQSCEASPIVGTVASRLFAMGVILYELFYREKLVNTTPTPPASPKDTDGDESRQQKRSSVAHSGSDRLEPTLLPWPVRNLLKNLLLDCKMDDNHGNDSYSSFVDLKQDLSLMLADPLRFVDDIKVAPSLPALVICDKLYGRDQETAKLDELYQQHIDTNKFQGVIISGGAGVGKSRLAMHTQKLTINANGYFSECKFQQNNLDVNQLSTIGTLLDKLCDSFVRGATNTQLKLVSKELETALGSQVGLIAEVVPNLTKLLPSYVKDETSRNCFDVAVSARFLFREFLRIIASHSSQPITLLIDDVQFADSASLLVLENLLFCASVFFVCCHRDDEDCQDNNLFQSWLASRSMIGLESIKLGNMSTDSINHLVSETFHVIPRITRPLSDILHHKTRGNPLFVRQLLGSLHGQGLIYVDLKEPRWAWDLDKIHNQPISSSVLDLLIKEMKRLPSGLQLGLGVASCFGSSINKNVLVKLSNDVGMDLIDILRQVCKYGFMVDVDNGALFRFSHDKIEQAG